MPCAGLPLLGGAESCSHQHRAELARMGARLLCLCLLTALLGYYIYSPLPEELAEPWTVMLTSAVLRAMAHLVS